MKTLLQYLSKPFKLTITTACIFGLSQNGISQAAAMIQDINTGGANSSPYLFTLCGGLNCIFFVAGNSSTGSELWKYDLSAKTATLVKDINPGAGGSGITSITANFAGNGILFNANDGTNGNELWKSDGTAAGTSMAVDINVGAGSSDPTGFFAYGGSFICSANDGINGKEPWVTGGTIGSTAMLKDINPGANSSDPANFMAANGKVMFKANDGSNGMELWGTDMTSGGTILLKDINTGINSSVPDNFAVLGSNLIFSATDAANGAELWKSDGTPGGTVLIKDINFGAGGSINTLPGVKAFFTNYGPAVFFQANDGTNGYELWKTDGTNGGTTLVKDVQSGPGSSNPSGLLATSANLFFFANDGATGMEIWMSDGTTGGTALLKDINVGAASSTGTTTTMVRSFSGPVYFAANNGTNGVELWRTLGSSGSTSMIADINPSGNSDPANMFVFGADAYFAANDGTSGIEPWNFDPLAAGVNETKNNGIVLSLYPNPCKGQLYLSSDEEKMEVSIYSLHGKLIAQYLLVNDNAKNYSLDLDELSSGVYFVKVVSGQKETVKKIILSE